MGDDELMLRYHDEEWGVPVHEDRKWFEYIVLDGFQAGLSWKTVLHKRESFRKVFHDFDPQKVAGMSDKEIEMACQNPAIIRNRLKIRAATKNARAFLEMQEKHDSFDTYIWSFTDGKVIHNTWKELEKLPARQKVFPLWEVPYATQFSKLPVWSMIIWSIASGIKN
jgi:DNA-3-methyladenine glycosylase I